MIITILKICGIGFIAGALLVGFIKLFQKVIYICYIYGRFFIVI